MAKRLTYVQNHDGNREWIIPAFADEHHTAEDYIYLCQHIDGSETGLEIVKIPRAHWDELVATVNTALGNFK